MAKERIPARDELAEEYTWNLRDIYDSDEKWAEEFAALESVPGELEKYRVASSAFPKQELRCIDLRPFNCTEQEIAFLSQFKGFYRPRQQVADTAYEKLYAWLGNPSYRPRCFLVPYRKNTE